MPLELTPEEARVVGCLMEKSVVTPDQYPMTLNALTNACNQKSSRNPVMSMETGQVQHTVRSLESKHLLRMEENFKTQVEKYTQRLCNTPFSDYTFDAAEFAVICVLLLRGPRTPGEVKANSGRLHAFGDNEEVVATLDGLIEREGGAVVVKLSRTPGRKDAEYMHLLSGQIDVSLETPGQEQHDAPVRERPSSGEVNVDVVQKLAQRVSDLEHLVDELRRQVSALQ
jgi:uncharacterized protein YceH (UPF0502 family)